MSRNPPSPYPEAAGYLRRPLRESGLRRLELAPRVELHSGSSLCVTQTSPAEPAADGWRSFTGDAPWLGQKDWLNATRGDWHNVSSDAVGHYAAIVLGTVVTGIIHLESLDPVSPLSAGPRQKKWRFNATPIARLVDAVAGSSPLEHLDECRQLEVARGSDEAVLGDLIGARVPPNQGPQVYKLTG